MDQNLKERFIARTCQLILIEGQFDMRTFTGYKVPDAEEREDQMAMYGHCPAEIEINHPKCGTACCIAGNMALAAFDVGLVTSLPTCGDVSMKMQLLWGKLDLEGVPDFYSNVPSLIGDDDTSYEYLAPVDVENVTPEVAVAQFLTGEPISYLATDSQLVNENCAKARELIQKHFGDLK